MSLRTSLFLSVVLAASAPLAAFAQPVSGLYIAGAAGINDRVSDFSRSRFSSGSCSNVGSGCDWVSTTITDVGVNPNYNVGFGLIGSVGWGIGNGLRAELEGNYRNNGISSIGVNGLGHADTSGTAHTYSVMTNLLFDMNISQNWIFPYIGAGVGYAWTRWYNVRPAGSSVAGLDLSSGGFAYQAMLGANFPIAAVPGLSLSAEYRFMGITGGTLSSARTGDHVCDGPINGCSTGRLSIGAQYNHAGLLGLRYAFGASSPAGR